MALSPEFVKLLEGVETERNRLERQRTAAMEEVAEFRRQKMEEVAQFKVEKMQAIEKDKEELKRLNAIVRAVNGTSSSPREKRTDPHNGWIPSEEKQQAVMEGLRRLGGTGSIPDIQAETGIAGETIKRTLEMHRERGEVVLAGQRKAGKSHNKVRVYRISIGPKAPRKRNDYAPTRETVNKVREAIVRIGTGTRVEICEASGISHETVRRAIKALGDEDSIVVVGEVTRGNNKASVYGVRELAMSNGAGNGA